MKINSIDEWYKYLDSQFTEQSKDAEEASETEKVTVEPEKPAASPAVAPSEPLSANFTVQEATVAPAPPVIEVKEADPIPEKPRIADKPAKQPSITASIDKTPDSIYDITMPSLEQYMPWLDDSPSEKEAITVLPVQPKPSKKPVTDSGQGEMEAIIEEIAVFEKAKEPPINKPVRKRKNSDQASPLSAPRPRWRTAEPQVSEEVARMWERLTRHIGFLTTINGYDAETQQTGRRHKTKNRADLISRLLDPVLSLEETALLLSVCPTTIRRYTEKGWLNHHRTAGNQRRFKLSDIVSFLEEHKNSVRLL